MIERRNINAAFASEVRNQSEGKNVLGSEFRSTLLELAKKYNQEYISHGAECVVVKLPKMVEGDKTKDKANPPFEVKKLAAFSYKDVSPERAKEIYYLQRFFSTIFPKNFPEFYSSLGKDPVKIGPKNAPSGTIRKEVELHPAYWEIENEEEPIYTFAAVMDICKNELGITLNVDLTHSGNLLHGADGGEYYVDTIKTMDDQKWDWRRIKKYIKDHPELYDKVDLNIVRGSLHRLRRYFPYKYRAPEEENPA